VNDDPTASMPPNLASLLLLGRESTPSLRSACECEPAPLTLLSAEEMSSGEDLTFGKDLNTSAEEMSAAQRTEDTDEVGRASHAGTEIGQRLDRDWTDWTEIGSEIRSLRGRSDGSMLSRGC
jgi:hypothetical protein